MSDNIKKMERFREAILAESSAETEALISDAKRQAEACLKEADDRFLRDSGNIVSEHSAKIRGEAEKLVSKRSFEAAKETVAHRNRLVEELFAEIYGELRAYTKTAAYIEKMKAAFEQADREMPFYEGVDVLVREDDLEAAGQLASAYSGVRVKADKSIRLGGITVYYPRENILLDKTLDEAFNLQKENFVNNREMQL